MIEYLSVDEVASLKDCSKRHIRRLVKNGELLAKKEKSEDTGKMELRFALEDLPKDLQRKYFDNLAEEKKIYKRTGEIKGKTYGEFSIKEREEIDLWVKIIKYWRENRQIYDKMDQADEDIIGALRLKLKSKGIKVQISSQILYRKFNALENNNLEGLIDKRGGHNKGTSSVPEPIWQGFLNYYLDERQPPFREAYRMTKYWAEEFYPEYLEEMPSESTFRRKYNTDRKSAVEIYKRQGLKALLDKCIPYVDRMYDDMYANDVWICDNHTLDIQSLSYEGSIHRLSVTAFMDAKSGIITGFNITDNPSMNSTIFALRNGILRYGKPRAILADNGSEFLTYDFAGRGIRKQNKDNVIAEYSTILGRLEIEFRTAKVKNAKAKNIERFFFDLKNHISRAFPTFTGGNITERPESLKSQIKKGNIPTDSRLREVMELLIEQENLMPYGGKDKSKYKDFSKLDVWNTSIKETTQIIVPEKDLDLYLMRAKNYQKVGRQGVYITVAGEKLWYNSEDYWQHIGKKVMARYDPTDLRQIRLYDEEDRYFETWNLEQELYLSFMESDLDKIADANEKIARITKAVKNYARDMIELAPETRIDILDLKIKVLCQ